MDSSVGALRRVSRNCASSTASSSKEPRKPLNSELVGAAIVEQCGWYEQPAESSERVDFGVLVGCAILKVEWTERSPIMQTFHHPNF
jgi:hypothetical protein